MERFSDFANEQALDGEKMRIDDIVGKEISVLAYEIHESRYKKNSSAKCLKLQFEVDGKRHVTFTGSQVLMRQCEHYKEHLPFIATIVKPDKYYSFS